MKKNLYTLLFFAFILAFGSLNAPIHASNAIFTEAISQNEGIAQVKKNLKFYPNPAVNVLNVDLGQQIDAEIDILNIIGERVYSEKGNFRTLAIDVTELPQGSYFLSIRIGNDRIVKRIEISK